MNTPEMPTALLHWSLYVDCPECQRENDLETQKHNSEYEISNRIFTNRWDSLAGWEVTCEYCGHEFKLGKVEH